MNDHVDEEGTIWSELNDPFASRALNLVLLGLAIGLGDFVSQTAVGAHHELDQLIVMGVATSTIYLLVALPIVLWKRRAGGAPPQP